MIASFLKMLFEFACGAKPNDCESASFEDLPMEVTSTVFRYLDADSLISTASVNKNFSSICKRDIVLRKRIRRRLRDQRKARVQAFFFPSRTIEVSRQFTAPVVPFGTRNGNVTVKVLSRVEYERPKEKKIYSNTFKKFKNSVQPGPQNNIKNNVVKKKGNKVFNSTKSVKTTRSIRL